ncbi:ATP-binding protein, partial [candidate division WOR-3 bacterium]|nr:ATP-binding protein [candidate division WOR-3 bacterium]
MIKRTISSYIRKLSNQYPVITITGPRQSGKTTLAKAIFKNKKYINLEDLEERAFAQSDPKGFLKKIPDGAILDEIQYAPCLVSYIQTIVDIKQVNGMFILTGSQQFEIVNSINQSLAGRTALIKLLPFSLSELENHYNYSGIDEIIFRGFYPRIYDQNLNPCQAYGDYIETYIERDLRKLINIKNISIFQKFLKLCAGRIGQILNLNSLSNDLGVSHTTIRQWITVLQASYIIFLLEPYYKNIRKRLIKSPKLYFYDTGLASFLLGVEKISYLEAHPLRGNLYENLVIMEVLKQRYNKGERNNLNFYRDKAGNEIDLIYNIAQHIIPIEIKSSETISKDFFKGFKSIEDILGIENIYKKILVYGGDREEKRNDIYI